MQMGILLATATLATSASGQAVTYSSPAQTTSRALAAISKLAGVPLACDPEMDKEVLVLGLKNATLEDVRSRIAQVTAGKWQSDGNGFRLVPDTAQRDADAKAEHDAIAMHVALELAGAWDECKDKASVAKGDISIGIFGSATVAVTGGPGERAIVRMARLIGPDAVADMAVGDRVVYSENPTAMQRALQSATIAPIMSDYISEHNEHILGSPAPELEPQLASLPGIDYALGLRVRPRVVKAQARVQVVITRLSDSLATYEMDAFDEEGKILAIETLNVPTRLTSLPAPDMAQRKPEKAPIHLSDLAQQELRAEADSSAIPSPELLAWLRDPVTNDPLSLADSEAFVQYAASQNEQLVADLPDDLSNVPYLMSEGYFPGTSFADLESESGAVSLSENGGWLVVRPARPCLARAQRLDRAALKTLLDSALLTGYASLSALIQAGPALSQSSDAGPIDLARRELASARGTGRGFTIGWDTYKFCSELAPVQWTSMRNGFDVKFSSLSDAAKATLSHMLYGADTDLSIGEPRESSPETALGVSTLRVHAEGTLTDTVLTEPTRAMPRGVPPDASISVREFDQPILTGSTSMASLAVYQFAKEAASQRADALERIARLGPFVPTFPAKVGTERIYWLTIRIGPTIFQSNEICEDAIDPRSPSYDEKSLPPAISTFAARLKEQIGRNPICQNALDAAGVLDDIPLPVYENVEAKANLLTKILSATDVDDSSETEPYGELSQNGPIDLRPIVDSALTALSSRPSDTRTMAVLDMAASTEMTCAFNYGTGGRAQATLHYVDGFLEKGISDGATCYERLMLKVLRAKLLYFMGNLEESKAVASEATRDWAPIPALDSQKVGHDLHMLLATIAVHQRDPQTAQTELRLAISKGAGCKGVPTAPSFPVLPKLIELGYKWDVISYLDGIQSWFPDGEQKVDEWRKLILDGKVPQDSLWQNRSEGFDF